jgi:hypothetical protein
MLEMQETAYERPFKSCHLDSAAYRAMHTSPNTRKVWSCRSIVALKRVLVDPAKRLQVPQAA